MKLTRDLAPLETLWPVKHGGTTIVNGALLMPGVTAETNLGVLILATTAAGDAVGILRGQFASTTSDTLVAGTVWNKLAVAPIVPQRIVNVPYDTSDTAAVASTSTTTVTITSLEDNIDTSYLYAVSGTGIGSIYFVDTSASGSCTTKTATAWDNTTTVIKILRLFHQLAKINSTADKIGTDAAAGSWTIGVMQNYLERSGSKEILDPTLHSGLTGLNSYPTKFSADVVVRNSTAYTVD